AAGQGVGEDLDGDLPALALVVAEVDRPHAALAEAAQDAVVAEAARLIERISRGPGRRRAGFQGGPVHGACKSTVASPALRTGRGEDGDSVLIRGGNRNQENPGYYDLVMSARSPRSSGHGTVSCRAAAAGRASRPRVTSVCCQAQRSQSA